MPDSVSPPQEVRSPERILRSNPQHKPVKTSGLTLRKLAVKTTVYMFPFWSSSSSQDSCHMNRTWHMQRSSHTHTLLTSFFICFLFCKTGRKGSSHELCFVPTTTLLHSQNGSITTKPMSGHQHALIQFRFSAYPLATLYGSWTHHHHTVLRKLLGRKHPSFQIPFFPKPPMGKHQRHPLATGHGWIILLTGLLFIFF